MIAVPMSIGTLFFFSILLLLWRKFHPRTFHKVVDSIPFFGCFGRWRKTREKNKQVRRMRSLGILTGDNDGLSGPVTGGTDTYARHLKKFEDDAARAREKMSFETPTRTPASPYTPGGKSRRSNSITALPKFGSPWKSPKHSTPLTESHDAIPLNPSPMRNGARAYGPFKRTNPEDTDSLQSWEEKWYALGSEHGTPRSIMKATTGVNEIGGHGMQSIDEFEAESGPGQSWRKLV
ncbi:hypothetical protein A1O7_04862 [Cladophialophora yegresii CBS 114405]|uniref:Uncharacterized protein n=1 Tax=Cladophialophora yegresii CBS 114405 TaxID=1182544 RepID=W9WQQ5_9EURO|nr:uncharacterized protein A1O7_04862 [Cladophialophora yegresii CBS 114405]EXJ60709.1 hypothetical protein A1O7_04862 [Cladophialophora yegresii CBS 114405]